MGKKRIAIIGEGEDQKEKNKEKHKKSLKEEKGIRVPGLKGGERVVAVSAEPIPAEEEEKEKQEKKAIPKKKLKGKKYLAAKMKIDPQKFYPIPEAVRLLKETSFSRFDGSAEIHLVVKKIGIQGEAVLPHFKGKRKKIEIASQETLKKIEEGKIDFDILLSTPSFMPNLLKYAKILGPKGLLPNPKNGTISDNPEETAKKFQKDSIPFKTEKNAPLIHSVFGKVSQGEKELEENLKALLKAVETKNIVKATIKATMGPAIKLDISTF